MGVSVAGYPDDPHLVIFILRGTFPVAFIQGIERIPADTEFKIARIEPDGNCLRDILTFAGLVYDIDFFAFSNSRCPG